MRTTLSKLSNQMTIVELMTNALVIPVTFCESKASSRN
jgi:hypothetical protein